MKVRAVGAELFHAESQTYGRTDRQTDRHDVTNGLFSQFCERDYYECRSFNRVVPKFRTVCPNVADVLTSRWYLVERVTLSCSDIDIRDSFSWFS
jgi:hypothetical protein